MCFCNDITLCKHGGLYYNIIYIISLIKYTKVYYYISIFNQWLYVIYLKTGNILLKYAYKVNKLN